MLPHDAGGTVTALVLLEAFAGRTHALPHVDGRIPSVVSFPHRVVQLDDVDVVPLVSTAPRRNRPAPFVSHAGCRAREGPSSSGQACRERGGQDRSPSPRAGEGARG